MPTLTRCLVLVAIAFTSSICVAPRHASALDLDVLRTWGLEVADEIEATLRVDRSSLYAETAELDGSKTGGLYGYSFVWPANTQFRALNSLMAIDPVTYAPVVRAYSDELRARYWHPTSGGYRAGAGPSERFYDDNAHLVVSLAEAYKLTGDQAYLDRAIETYDFVLSGENSIAGGGIYFREGSTESKDTVSTLQGARAGAILYQITQESDYLTDSIRLLEWTNSHVQLSGGTYNQGFVISTMTPGGVDIVNATGIGISANVELYRATGDSSYLTEAQRVANRAYARFFDSGTGRINDESYWAFELVEGFNELYLADRNTLWRSRLHTALGWLEGNKQDPNGRYPLFWGRGGASSETLEEWHLNEMSAAAQAFLDTSLAILPGDVNLDGRLTSRDVDAFVAGWRAETSGLSNLDQIRAGDLNRDGVTNFSDWSILRTAFEQAGIPIEALSVPEPATGGLVALALVALVAWRRSDKGAGLSHRPTSN